MDDSVLYTGVDGDGVFGNEHLEEEVKEKITEQERLLTELTPQLEEIIEMIDNEKETHLKFIAGYVDNSTESDEVVRSKIQASALYRTYLDGLKTQFTLKLNQTRGK